MFFCILSVTFPIKFNTVYFADTFVEAQEITIATFPFLPQNVVAANYSNLQIIVSITGFPIVCSWQILGRTMVFYQPGSCVSDVSNADYSSVCEEDKNFINLTYTIRTPLRDVVNFQVTCNFPQEILSEIDIYVQSNKI